MPEVGSESSGLPVKGGDAGPREKALETLGFPCQRGHLAKGRRGNKREVFLHLILTSRGKPRGREGMGILEESGLEGQSPEEAHFNERVGNARPARLQPKSL